MIAKLVKGRGFLGVASYLFHGTKDEHRDRGRMVFSNLAGRNAKELAWEFRRIASLRSKMGKAVFHASLSLAPEDRTLNEAEWSRLAQRFMNELGFAECPFVAIRHDDTEHAHIHILASRVSVHGNAVSDQNDYRRAEKIMRGIEADFQLRPVQSSHLNNDNNKEDEVMDEKMQKFIEGRLDAAVAVASDCGVAECGDDKLTDKKRRNYQRRLLEDSYSRQVAMMLGDICRFVEKKPGKLIVHTTEGGKIEDAGDKLTAFQMPPKDSAERLILLCVSKGWESVVLSGNDEFLRVAMRMALQRGLKVKAVGTNQLTILAEIETEIFASVKQADTTAAMPSPETKIPAKPEPLSGLAGIGRRLDVKRQWDVPPMSSNPKFPRWKP